jgi:sugar phosphate permease
VLTYVQRQGFIAATPYIKQDLGLQDSQMGYLAAVWLVAYGLFQVPGGLIGDRIGSRHLLTILVLGWSLTLGVVGLTVFLPAGGWLPLAALLALRFVFGMFQAGSFPGMARVLADWMPMQQRGFAQGMNWTFSRLGGFVAPLLVVWLITAVFGGWAVPCWLLAALGLIWCALFWPWFRNRPHEMSRVNHAEREFIASGQTASKVPSMPVPWQSLLASRSVWGLCLMYGFLGFAGNFVTSLLPIYLRDHRQLSDEQTAWLSGLPLACGIVSCLLGGVLSDWLIRRTGSRKWGRRVVGGAAMILAGGACLSAIWSGEVWMIGVSVSAWFFFNDATMGPAWAACADVGVRDTGTLSGAMNMTGAFIGAIGMALAGRLLNAHEYDLMFIIFASSYGLAALCWLAVDVTKPLTLRSRTI